MFNLHIFFIVFSINNYNFLQRDEVNLKFVKEARSHRRFRPGYSARRYLSKLTRSLDSTFLDNLITKGEPPTLFFLSFSIPLHCKVLLTFNFICSQ